MPLPPPLPLPFPNTPAPHLALGMSRLVMSEAQGVAHIGTLASPNSGSMVMPPAAVAAAAAEGGVKERTGGCWDGAHWYGQPIRAACLAQSTVRPHATAETLPG
jgi:hypothetical protein